MLALGEKLSDEEIAEMVQVCSSAWLVPFIGVARAGWQEADLDKDGKINLKDFTKMMTADA
jgi:Ca2+-binding EF-hand superfamily protein